MSDMTASTNILFLKKKQFRKRKTQEMYLKKISDDFEEEEVFIFGLLYTLLSPSRSLIHFSRHARTFHSKTFFLKTQREIKRRCYAHKQNVCVRILCLVYTLNGDDDDDDDRVE